MFNCHLSLKKFSHLQVRTGSRKQKIGDNKIFIFFQPLNSNFRCSATMAAVLFAFKAHEIKQFTENLFFLVILYKHYEADTEADKVASHVMARFASTLYLYGVLLQ